MHEYVKEIRTPNKHLLVGNILRENDRLYLVIKNRGKTDSIALDLLFSYIYFEESESSEYNLCE